MESCSSNGPPYALILLDINGCTVAGVSFHQISFPNYKSAVTTITNGTEKFLIQILDISDNKDKLIEAEKKWSKGSRAKAIYAEIKRRKTGRQKDHGFLCILPECKNKPNCGTRIGHLEEFIDFIQPGAHIAVYRPPRFGSFGYYHHYIIIDQECDEKLHYINIIHYTSVAKTGSSGFPGGKIIKEKIELRQDNKNFFDFEAGVYFIQKEGYPKTEHEAAIVVQRAMSRLGECLYSAASNNCESFATWASTGKAECDQMNDANELARFIVDALDVDHIKLPQKLINVIASTVSQILLKTGTRMPDLKKAARALAAIIAKLKSVSPSVVQEATTNLSKDTVSSVTSEAANSIASEITEAASGSAFNLANIGKTAGVGVSITLLIESIDLAIRIYNLYRQKQNGQCNDVNFKREILKACSGAASSVIFTAIGTAVGMALSPHIICVAVGGLIGGILGKVFGPSIAGLIHDTIINELHETPALA